MAGVDASTAPSVPFRPRAPWWGADLQTLRNFLLRVEVDLSGWPGEDLVLPMRDGSGDQLLAVLHRPLQATRPLAMLVHGLAGSAESSYIRATAAHLLALGHPVLRLNLRGAGPSRATCRLQYHAGRTDDLADAIAALPPNLLNDGLCLVGFSLGGNAVLKLMGEGRGLPVRAAVSISAPIDLGRTARRFLDPRNFLYHRWMLARMQREAIADGAAITAPEREAVLAARTVIEFDDRFVAPRNGFNGADDYYARCSAVGFLSEIRAPTLVIHAADDPWIPAQCYRDWNWIANKALTLALTEGGGHVGFHDADGDATWYDRRIGDFFARA